MRFGSVMPAPLGILFYIVPYWNVGSGILFQYETGGAILWIFVTEVKLTANTNKQTIFNCGDDRAYWTQYHKKVFFNK